MAQNLSYLWHSTFETGAVQLCPITEIAPESAFVWSCRWYCFRVDARVNWYGVYLAEIKCARVTGFPPFSRAYRVLVRLNFPSPWKGPAPQLRSQGPLLLVSRTLGTRLTYHPSQAIRSEVLYWRNQSNGELREWNQTVVHTNEGGPMFCNRL